MEADLEEPTISYPIEKSYECAECDYRTKNNGHLKRHEKTHTIQPIPERTFECEICHKMMLKGSLKSHLLSHGDKKFECKVCHKKFSWKQSLNIHYQIVHQKSAQLFQCDLCDYSTNKNMRQFGVAHEI